MSRLAVQHWIACLDARVVPPVGATNFYNLLGVGHVHTFAADVEFPAAIPVLNVFARFMNGAGVKRFEAEVFWLAAPEGERLVNYYPPCQVTFRPNEVLRDYTFRLVNVSVGEIGLHSIRLYQSKQRGRKVLANEYFYAVQLS